MAVADSELVQIGQRIGDSGSFQAGSGCYTINPHIYSSLVGFKQVKDGVITVIRDKTPTVFPDVGDVVTCKVAKLFTHQAMVEILCVGKVPLAVPYVGKIRKENVRSFDVDSVEIYKSFRPCDIVRATVISLGDSKSYFLSTAELHLGVILATSPAGFPMVPISWDQMQCPTTSIIEYRKVAKIID